MEQEAPHWDFDRYVAAADADWEKQLGKIEVKGTEVQKEIFYTALYHTMIQPNPACPAAEQRIRESCRLYDPQSSEQ